MDFNLSDWLEQPITIVIFFVILGLFFLFCSESIGSTIKFSSIIKLILKSIGEALIIVGIVEAFIGIKFIKNAVLEGVRETLIEYQFIDNLDDDTHRKILARIVANKFKLKIDDPVVAFYSADISDSLISPQFIQDKKIAYTISLDNKGKGINLVRQDDKTVYLGEKALIKEKSIYPGIYDYTLRLNGKECEELKTDSSDELKPPTDKNAIKLGDLNCQVESRLPSKQKGYSIDATISSSKTGGKAQVFSKMQARIKSFSFTEFIAISSRIKNVDVTVNYPNEVCNMTIAGFGKFEKEAEEAQKEHDNKDDEFHYLFEGEYGPDSLLYLTVNCSKKDKCS
jgi:hypothetical protein